VRCTPARQCMSPPSLPGSGWAQAGHGESPVLHGSAASRDPLERSGDRTRRGGPGRPLGHGLSHRRVGACARLPRAAPARPCGRCGRRRCDRGARGDVGGCASADVRPGAGRPRRSRRGRFNARDPRPSRGRAPGPGRGRRRDAPRHRHALPRRLSGRARTTSTARRLACEASVPVVVCPTAADGSAARRARAARGLPRARPGPSTRGRVGVTTPGRWGSARMEAGCLSRDASPHSAPPPLRFGPDVASSTSSRHDWPPWR
jgi:hypothetical protein